MIKRRFVGETRKSRTIVLLVDCLLPCETGVFGAESEGAFLLRLGSLLAGGSGGRLVLLSVVPVPQGESVSSYSITAQSRRQDLEKQALNSLSQSTGRCLCCPKIRNPGTLLISCTA